MFEKLRKSNPSAGALFGDMPVPLDNTNFGPLMDFRAEIMAIHIQGVNHLALGEEDMKIWRKIRSNDPDKEESFRQYYQSVENDKSNFAVSRYNFALYLLKQMEK